MAEDKISLSFKLGADNFIVKSSPENKELYLEAANMIDRKITDYGKMYPNKSAVYQLKLLAFEMAINYLNSVKNGHCDDERLKSVIQMIDDVINKND